MPYPPPRPAAAPASERVRQFCSAVLAALDDGGGGELPEALARALGAGVADVADGLRREVAALDAAAAELRHLPTRFLGPQPAVAALLADLEAARGRAARVLDSLDALADPHLPPRPLPAPEPDPPPADERHGYDLADEPPVPADDPDPPPADDTAVVLAGADDTAAHPPADPTRRAARLFADGQRHQRRHEFDRADERYTAAIATDPRFGPAYSRRGQVRLARGDVDAAVADFDAALALDDTAAEAWCWRGDARVVAGRTAEAAADYARAVALRPDLARTRFNLAVALRKLGHTRRALAELDRVVADRPDFAPAHLQRALIRLQLGDRAGAEAGFRTALDLDPECDEAKRQLAALAPAPTGPPAPKAVAAKDAGQVVVNCPGCGEPGGVGWDRLGRVFACGKCKKRFGVKADGAAVELVQTPDGRWAEAPRLRAVARKKRTRRAVLAGVAAAAVLLPAVGLAGWRATRAAAAAPAEEPLPADLAARAEVFARAWAAGDTRTLRRCAPPGDERTVFAWYTRHRPPAALRPPAGATDPPEGTQVDVAVTLTGTNRAVVRARVSNPRTAAGQPPAELTMTWEERGDAWRFVPPRR